MVAAIARTTGGIQNLLAGSAQIERKRERVFVNRGRSGARMT